jgi:hypothetical protein
MRTTVLSRLGLCGLGLLWILVNSAFSAERVVRKEKEELNTCGVFRVEGVLRESANYPKYLEFVTDQNSRSERRILLGKMGVDDLQSVKDLRVAGKLRLFHFCIGDCFGEWLGTEKMLPPTEKPKSFAAAPASIRIKTEECLTIEESKKRVLR